MNESILIFADPHAPYMHRDAVPFLTEVKSQFRPDCVVLMGDECFPPEAEILTPEGFVRFDALKDQPVGQWHEDGRVEFVAPTRHVRKSFTGSLLEFRHKTMVSRTTPRHNLVKVDSRGQVHRREAWDYVGSESWHIPTTMRLEGSQRVDISDSVLRLMVAFQADGTWTKGAARFTFSKEKKAVRLMELLQTAGIPYNTHASKRGNYSYYIEKAHVPECFTKEFSIPVTSFSQEQLALIAEEVMLWDGTPIRNGWRYSSAVLANMNYVQTVALLAGYDVSCIRAANEEASCYYVSATKSGEKCSLKSARIANIPYSGDVFCVTVPTGMIVVRQDGHISVSGNCDSHAASYHESDPDLHSAGAELGAAILALMPLYKLFPKCHVLDSNHGSLALRKARSAGLSSMMIKDNRDVLRAPKGWTWTPSLTLRMSNGKHVFFHHGKSSVAAKLSKNMSMSSVEGHFHSKFDLSYWANPTDLYFAMHVGCLIDDKSMAYRYNKVDVERPILGCAVIQDGVPRLIPMTLNSRSRWVGQL